MGKPDAAVAIVYTHDPHGSVLLMRRTERENDPWSGHWAFPGGRCESDDPDVLHTALRELEEECGVHLGPEDLERPLQPVMARGRAGRFPLVAPFVFRVPAELQALPDPLEAAEAVWVPLGVLRDPAQHGLRPAPGFPHTTLFPSIALGPVPLWGFTYRLMTTWLELAPMDAERAGFEAANRILSFLLEQGLDPVRPWESGKSSVRGLVPVNELLHHLSTPNGEIPAVNLVEVSPMSVRIVGLAFEEYVIEAGPNSPGDSELRRSPLVTR